METPDLSSLTWEKWVAFCHAQPRPEPYNARTWTYNPEADYYTDDLDEFRAALAANDPPAIAVLPALVLWRMNNNQGEQQ